MDKRWYPAALSIVLVGCGGATDTSGNPHGCAEIVPVAASGSSLVLVECVHCVPVRLRFADGGATRRSEPGLNRR